MAQQYRVNRSDGTHSLETDDESTAALMLAMHRSQDQGAYLAELTPTGQWQPAEGEDELSAAETAVSEARRALTAAIERSEAAPWNLELLEQRTTAAHGLRSAELKVEALLKAQT